MESSFLVPIVIVWGRVNGMASRNWGWYPRFFKEALCPECSFSRNVGEGAEWVMKTF
tara:strand:- start:360 stop:530 length:171 start_codon:yes stop_codon:yes gene_type:complete